MKSILDKTAKGTAGIVVTILGCAMAGLGLTMIAVLVLISLAAAVVAAIATPFFTLLACQRASHSLEAGRLDHALG